ncbi:MAG TPA: DUF692 domain-containing protein [Burkholderiales bacterium]|nr:DUF692 domain-containing protein [Burkholderiales bacterium]
MNAIENRRRGRAAIPVRVGIGLRPPHYRQLLSELPAVGWLEVHSENYFSRGGQPLHFLARARGHYPLSLHGVGLSLGSADALSTDHLMHLKRLIERLEPGAVSDHLCWGAIGGRHLNDLLPLPYTDEALQLVCAHIDEAQAFLGRELLIENVSSYLQFSASVIPEWEFLAAVARRTGCGILLDVNNIYVSSVNHGFDPLRYLEAMPDGAVQEVHLAGFDTVPVAGGTGGSVLIDTHGKRVAEPVWNLYREALSRLGAVPTLIEWDTDIPPLATLLEEARKAQEILDRWSLAEAVDALAA